MNMDTKLAAKRWQNCSNLLLGTWLFISPWITQYPSSVSNTPWGAHILGATVVLISAIAVYIPSAWEEGINMALGIWMIVLPWVLGFASYRDITANAVIDGALVTAFAPWAMVHDKNFEKWRHDRHAAS
jgi:hypothetical protein